MSTPNTTEPNPPNTVYLNIRWRAERHARNVYALNGVGDEDREPVAESQNKARCDDALRRLHEALGGTL